MRENALFLAKFFIIFGVLQTIIYFAPITPLNAWIAGFEGSLTGLESEGIRISSENANFIITNSCTGLVSGSILAAIVFGLRKPELKLKAGIFLAGAAALFLVNLARIYFVVAAGLAVSAGFAETLHTVSWFVMSGAIIALWYCLTKRHAGIKDFSELL